MRPSLWRIIIGQEITQRHAAWLCVLAALGLSLLGIYSIDLASGVVTPPGVAGATSSGHAYAVRQCIFLGVGLLAAGLITLPHYRWIRWLAWPAMVGCLGLLVFLLLPFVPTSIVAPRNGARCWIDLGPIEFQPGEVAKVAFVLVLADYLRFRQNHRTLGGLLPPAAIAFIPAALITLQPDLGMALLFVPALFAMLLTAGAKMKHLVIVVLIAMLASPAAYPLLKPHQKARIDGLIKMIRDPKQGADGINYQALTAQMLGGAGQLTGVSDAKARALITFAKLPERHNDMILAVILTRFGLLGGLAMLGLYALWFAGAYATAALSKDAFGRLVVVGFMAIIFAQTFVNVGMTIGLMPIVGLTLPFVSYGGTSLLTVWGMTGLIVSIAMRRPTRLARPAFEFGASEFESSYAPASRASGMMGRR